MSDGMNRLLAAAGALLASWHAINQAKKFPVALVDGAYDPNALVLYYSGSKYMTLRVTPDLDHFPAHVLHQQLAELCSLENAVSEEELFRMIVPSMRGNIRCLQIFFGEDRGSFLAIEGPKPKR